VLGEVREIAAAVADASGTVHLSYRTHAYRLRVAP
jgi:hypothetical protein